MEKKKQIKKAKLRKKFQQHETTKKFELKR